MAQLTALVLAVALLAAPAARACCEAGAEAARCPMQDMGDSVEAPPCHGGDRLAEDCCEIERAPAPMPAGAFDGGQLAAPVDGVFELVVTAPAPVDAAARAAPPRAGWLHELGRYTLYASLLL